MKCWWDDRRSRAQTVLDTLEMVRSQEPIAPSHHATEDSRDLETICLKCLQKDPKNRYHAAGALAEDLRRLWRMNRFLRGGFLHGNAPGNGPGAGQLRKALVAVSVLFALSLAVGGVAFGALPGARRC